MIAYILKTVICSAVLLLVYFLFLEKEKMHHFNRFYLLLSIALSFIIPFITLEIKAPVIPLAEVAEIITVPVPSTGMQQVAVDPTEQDLLPIFLLVFYSTVTAFLLYRFTRNLVILCARARNNPSVSYAGAKVVLTPAPLVPCSFLNYIFVSREEFKKGAIEEEILYHELTHVKQKHSADILLLELLLVFVWFHPFLYLYKKAVRLNHEFLADQSVISTFEDTLSYQYLLLDRAGRPSPSLFTHSFNYLITKKRMIMMTKKTSAGIALLKQAMIVPLAIAACGLVFSTRVMATPTDTLPAANRQPKQETLGETVWAGRYAGSTLQGVSQGLLTEYENIIHKYKTTGKGWSAEFRKNILPADRDRLETIFKQMSREQQEKQVIAFVVPPPPLPKVIPTEKQLESFKNAKTYGVWINDKKVSNSTLNNYANTDFSQVFISKLYGAAKKNVSYSYQVDLMTKHYYENYYNQAIADKQNIMVMRSFRKKTDTEQLQD